MTNEYYSPSGAPSQNSSGSSSTMRGEFGSIEDGFDKMPALSGNGDKPVFTNTGGTAMETKTAAQARSLLDSPAKSGDNTFSGDNVFSGFIGFGAPSELTIASGVVTATASYHKIDTESDAGTDDLDTINGGSDGDILILRSVVSGRDPTAKDGTGNLSLAGDFTFATNLDRLILVNTDSNGWVEIARSTN